MDGLIASLDNLLKPVNDAIANLDRAQLVRWVAIYMLVAGIFSLCGGLAIMGVGTLAGFGGLLGGVAMQTASETTGLTQQEIDEANRAISELGTVSGFAVFWGLLSAIAGPVLLVGALGLFQRANWGRMLAAVAFLINAVVSLLGILSGGSGLISILWVLVSGYLAYLFYRDEGIKAQFG